jgi:hypothetical protein
LTGPEGVPTIRPRASSPGGRTDRSDARTRRVARFDTWAAKPHHSTSAPRAFVPRPLHLNN